MYKRALMLTAATVALLSGPAFGAATTITTSTTAPLTTDANGPITLTSPGTIVIPSSSSATAAATAIEINSATPANNIVTIGAGTTVSYNGTPFAEAIQADPGTTGEILSGGEIDLTGSGTDKNGIVFGDPISSATGIFTGVVDTTNNTPAITNVPFSPSNPTGLTALDLQQGSTISVVGDGSNAIEVLADNTVNGDILLNGTITMQQTSTTAVSTTSGSVTAMNMAGTLNGNLEIGTGAAITSTGATAEGIIDVGQINGSVTNFGTIDTIGLTTTLTAKQQQEEAAGQPIDQAKPTGNPEAGSALVIAGNVTGGIYNGGPGNGDTTTARATIEVTSNEAALDITPSFAGAVAAPITIGGLTDPLGVFGQVSLLNRGIISATPTNLDDSAIAVAIAGVSPTTSTSVGNTVTLSDGLVNAGTIAAGAITDVNASASSLTTALLIGNYVTVGNNTGTASGFGPGYALVNSNESGSGTIQAEVSGAGSGAAVAIEIGTTTSSTGTSVPSLFNSGTISASATSTDATISNLTAYAILDNSGTLLNITNTGTISATSGAEITSITGATTLVPLDDSANISRAIWLPDAAGSVTLTDSGIIKGDILLGQSADTVSVAGTSAQQAVITGNLFFAGSGTGSDVLNIGQDATFTGNVLEQPGGQVDATVLGTGVLDVTNNGSTVNNNPIWTNAAANACSSAPTSAACFYSKQEPNFIVGSLDIKNGGTLGLTLAQAFNQQTTSSGTSIIPVVQSTTANSSTGVIDLEAGSILNLNFGSFVASTSSSSTTSRFVLFDAPSGNLIIASPNDIKQDITGSVPFLFTGTLCGYNLGASFNACTGPAPRGTDSDLVLDLTPKAAGGAADSTHLGLTGYALKMFPLANKALANDPTLGAEVIAAGNGIVGVDAAKTGQGIYQGIYSAFAPDVTGATRAIAIALTDQATGAVGARQRALRMYAGLDGDATLWGQEFVERLNTGASNQTTGYDNTGFGFALGADSGTPHSGRYGVAFTFYSGTTSEKAPRTSKTRSEWAMLTGYSDWRGHGLFVDTQFSAGYSDTTGSRSIVIGNAVAKCNNNETCTAEGKRPGAMLSGGVTAGTIYHSGGTVFIPQVSLDGLALREDGYTETTPNLATQATSGFDLHVNPYYAESLRAFAGADLRQDLKFGDYFVQPEGRAGFRYDFLDGAEKLKAEFACSAVATGSCGNTDFSITGPDPAKANLVLGGGIAVTTGAWSLGLNYDYLQSVGGSVKSVDQEATFTLVGRI